jgi:hypothetical protein
MNGKQIALYVASFVLCVCKKRNANKQTEVVETKKEEE